MKIQLGKMNTVDGTVETSEHGLVYTPASDLSAEQLQRGVESMRFTWPDTGKKATDEELLASLPARMRSPHAWAQPLDGVVWAPWVWDEKMAAARARLGETLGATLTH